MNRTDNVRIKSAASGKVDNIIESLIRDWRLPADLRIRSAQNGNPMLRRCRTFLKWLSHYHSHILPHSLRNFEVEAHKWIQETDGEQNLSGTTFSNPASNAEVLSSQLAELLARTLEKSVKECPSVETLSVKKPPKDSRTINEFFPHVKKSAALSNNSTKPQEKEQLPKDAVAVSSPASGEKPTAAALLGLQLSESLNAVRSRKRSIVPNDALPPRKQARRSLSPIELEKIGDIDVRTYQFNGSSKDVPATKTSRRKPSQSGLPSAEPTEPNTTSDPEISMTSNKSNIFSDASTTVSSQTTCENTSFMTDKSIPRPSHATTSFQKQRMASFNRSGEYRSELDSLYDSKCLSQSEQNMDFEGAELIGTPFLSQQLETLSLDTSVTASSKCPPPKSTANKLNAREEGRSPSDLQSRLEKHGIFSLSNSRIIQHCPLRVRYEITRVSLHCQVPIDEIGDPPFALFDKYDELWSWLHQRPSLAGHDLPIKSSMVAWNAAQDGGEVSLNGALEFEEHKDKGVFKFRLSPLEQDASHRFGRKFGNDRFLAVDFPSIARSKLPKILREDSDVIGSCIAEHLIKADHFLFGRTWKAFFTKKSRRSTGKSPPMAIVYLFATEGCEITKRPAIADSDEEAMKSRITTVKELLQWFVNLDLNSSMKSCKLFSRISLGLSRARPTIVLKQNQIRIVDDIRSHPKLDSAGNKVDGEIMNDGCGLISRPLAIAIAKSLGLDGTTPSVFQGRIGSAKGLWMIDKDYCFTTSPETDQDYWIEISKESQSKFRLPKCPSKEFLTFEALNWSKPVSSASLNLQFLPILRDRGVPQLVLKKALERDLTYKISELKSSLKDPVAFRKWCQDQFSVSADRIRYNGVVWEGGMPSSMIERIIFLLESGFKVDELEYLESMAWKLCSNYCDRLLLKLNISVGQSCFCYCIADPLGVLKPGQVHLGFSSTFKDPHSDFQTTLLHNTNALVSRTPAHKPSDIQKVNCVFCPELRHLCDVIVFPTKGDIPLASMLSGGDYDGDTVWVCWDQAIVEPFTNAPAPDIITLDLKKDSTVVSEFQGLDSTEQFLRHNFSFRLRPNMLGSCTKYKERYTYGRNCVSDKTSLLITELLSDLVDAPKLGISFSDDDWFSFQKQHGLPESVKETAYQTKERPRNGCKHIVDYLYFNVAMRMIEELKTKFLDPNSKASCYDADLGNLWKYLENLKDSAVHDVVGRLKKDIEQVNKSWQWRMTSRADLDLEELTLSYASSSKPTSWGGQMLMVFEEYQKILPGGVHRSHDSVDFAANDALARFNNNPAVDLLLYESKFNPHFSFWNLIKASCIFACTHRNKKKIPWFMAGRQLGFLKSQASVVNAIGEARCVVSALHTCYRIDGKLLGQLQGRFEPGHVIDDGDRVSSEQANNVATAAVDRSKQPNESEMVIDEDEWSMSDSPSWQKFA